MDTTRLPPRWWMLFPKRERLEPKDHPTTETPEFSVGDSVELRLKPERERKILEIAWHRHRRRYVYVIETSSPGFEPYWFADQLAGRSLHRS